MDQRSSLSFSSAESATTSRDDGTGLVQDVRKGRAGSRTPARNTSPAVAQIGLDIASPCAAAAARPQATAGRAASRRSRRVDDGRPRIYWGAISFSRWSLDTRVAPGFPALRSRPAGERRCHRRPLPLTFAGASSPLAGVPMSSKSVGRLSATLFGNRHVGGLGGKFAIFCTSPSRRVKYLLLCARQDAGSTFQRFAAADTSMVLAIAPA